MSTVHGESVVTPKWPSAVVLVPTCSGPWQEARSISQTHRTRASELLAGECCISESRTKSQHARAAVTWSFLLASKVVVCTTLLTIGRELAIITLGQTLRAQNCSASPPGPLPQKPRSSTRLRRQRDHVERISVAKANTGHSPSAYASRNETSSYSGEQDLKRGLISNSGASAGQGSLSYSLTRLGGPAGSGHTSDGDDVPGRRPNQTQRKQRKAEVRQNRYSCVYFGSNRSDVTGDCSTLKQYVSQLRRHHERHEFYYCTNCFAKFPSASARENHTETGLCSFMCVTEHCPNYNTALLFTQGVPCNHRRGENSQTDQWRFLFRLARPNDDLPGRLAERVTPRTFSTHQNLPSFPTISQPGIRQAQAGDRLTHPPLAPALVTQNFDASEPKMSTDPIQGLSSMAQLADTALSLYQLAERLQSIEHKLEMPTRQTIDWLNQHTELSFRQLSTIASNALPASELDTAYPSYPPAKTDERSLSLGKGGSAEGKRKASAGSEDLISESMDADGNEFYDRSDDKGLDVLGLNPAPRVDSDEAMIL